MAGWVELGPDLARDGVVRWRGVDLQERIGREWGISLHERTGKRGKTPGEQVQQNKGPC